ncbi:hypothetical protein D3C76_919810 [compost metagenome]
MNFLRLGWPIALLRYQMSLTSTSLASEPELVKYTLLIGTGASAISFSAREMLEGCDLWLKVW